MLGLSLLLSVGLGGLGEPAAKGRGHVGHGFLLGLFHHDLLLLEPLLAVLANLLLQELVVALATLAGEILQHLALGKGLAGVLLALGEHGHAHVAGLQAEQAAEGTDAGAMAVRGSLLS